MIKPKGYKIALDCGHGLKTAGKRTPPFPVTNKVIHEWEFNHATATILKSILEKQGHTVLMVSDTKDDTPLKVRTDRANNWGADIFISIHYNAFQSVWGGHGGIETLYSKGSVKGKELAELVQKELIAITGLRNRGAKPRNDLWVLGKTKMPAILPELGFMDNLVEANLMLDVNYQTKCANAIATGVNKFLKYVPMVKQPVKQPAVIPAKPSTNLVDVNCIVKNRDVTLKGLMVEGSNYVPIRDLAELVGLKVSWDAKTNTVILK